MLYYRQEVRKMSNNKITIIWKGKIMETDVPERDVPSHLKKLSKGIPIQQFIVGANLYAKPKIINVENVLTK